MAFNLAKSPLWITCAVPPYTVPYYIHSLWKYSLSKKHMQSLPLF